MRELQLNFRKRLTSNSLFTIIIIFKADEAGWAGRGPIVSFLPISYQTDVRVLLCSVAPWTHQTQVEQLEAVQRRAIRIIFEVTSHMPYHSAMACANISSLHARREDINKQFFRKILNNPDNPLFNLLPPPRDAAIVGRLRSAHLLPSLRTRTSKYRSFIHYGLTHYQPKLKWNNHHFLQQFI